MTRVYLYHQFTLQTPLSQPHHPNSHPITQTEYNQYAPANLIHCVSDAPRTLLPQIGKNNENLGYGLVIDLGGHTP
ncbi:hypothetical protein [Legionella pneumophila]|uniref:Uncharacterized protein n=1 Tax=Legionella pneumophila subsp. pascullei TaxID=91890 RepID=A0AAX2ISL9_LEGPN|nr:hypothetical protein [Legionella pneumophila]AMP88226.1 hypothetical protein AXF35_00295 [Legionella pneumophila subsp. pascullei]AMP91135.1 hypothetical protein AXF36_00295 [Legionella pneumophila subsp. pascullei]AMP94122.1 hypothetical protein AXF37_00295 [Legionella pneumophila subsp. pascullei]SQG88898.1 Uncharacterised protein [Legionella pneumophila subsp. pascullei]VEH03948.1 Uncharacterised protein [Legionella pneumophila subsp. pascullei]